MTDISSQKKAKVSSDVWPLNHLFQLSRRRVDAPQFFIAARQRKARYVVSEVTQFPDVASDATLDEANSGWFAQSLSTDLVPIIGDNPQQLHPRYVMAVLSSRSIEKPIALRDFPIPAIEFSTLESVRRSMTLNSMRMSLEYFQDGSLRVLELVENRLAAKQRDVVHDLCVYLMRHLLDIRAREREARFLRAESVAAFLGLNEKRVQQLFLARRLSASSMTQKLEENYAGTIRRKLDVEQLVSSQIVLLRPQLRHFEKEEDQLFTLLDAVVARLRA